MKTRITHAVAASLVLLVVAASSRGRAQEKKPPTLAPGENLTYDVSWSIFRAGRVTVTLGQAGKNAGDSYEVTALAQSQGFVSLLFTVRNEYHTFFDPRTICSGRISKKINEGGRHRETTIVFDAARGLAILDERDPARPDSPPKHAENAIPGCVEDVVSAFYYLRRQELSVGHAIHLPINDGAKTSDVTVEVQAREQVQTPFGSRAAFRVEPKVFGGLYKRKGRMLIWFSDDGQRLPLRIKMMISAGTLIGNLRSVTVQPPSGSLPKP